jgi:hypothetical protein
MRALLIGKVHASDAVEFCELGGIVNVHLVDHTFESGLGPYGPLQVLDNRGGLPCWPPCDHLRHILALGEKSVIHDRGIGLTSILQLLVLK